MSNSSHYLLEFLFDESRVSPKALEDEVTNVLEADKSTVHLQVSSVPPAFVKLTIRGSIADVDVCHDRISRTLCSKYPSIRLLDEAGDEVRRRAYPVLATIEQRLRTFINRAMVQTIGFDWWDLKIRPTDRENVQLVKERSGGTTLFQHPLDLTQFDYLVKLVTDSPQEWSSERSLSAADLVELLSSCDSVDGLRTSLQKKMHRSSLWDEVFSLYFEDKSQWESLSRQLTFVILARHKVMHHRPIRLGELTGLARIESTVNDLLNSAKLQLSSEDQSKAQSAGQEILDHLLQSDLGSAVTEMTEAAEEKEGWEELIDIFLDLGSNDEDIADAGYRLSWYFPAVSANLRRNLQERLAGVSDPGIFRIIRVVHNLLKDDAEPMADLLTDLLAYIPDVAARIRQAIETGQVSEAYMQTAKQVLATAEQRSEVWPTGEA